MSTNPETKRWGRVVAVILGVGLLIFIPLVLVARHMIDAANLRARIASNEMAAIDTIDLIAAAEQIYLDAYGQYGSLQQLIDAGILNMSFTGDPPAFKGYGYTLRITPRTEMQSPAFSVNADPLRDRGDDATGTRHFYRGSDVTGIRYSEERPAAANDTLLPRAAPL
ncbi:MAG TPA: hypothetical protein VM934_04180 [Pyrinomonadaceae bacterium]|jgi:hypothetical protein|nr:hypothetical protein [Pyrinomonadaceae bacterium]